MLERAFNALVIWMYRLSGGRLMGKLPPAGAPLALLTTVGRKSGRKRTTPVLYLQDGESFALVASHAGAPSHPGWFFNLEAHPEAELEVRSRRLRVRGRRATVEEKAVLWPRLVAIFPPYADYQKKTTRDIPVVILAPV